MTNGLDIWVIQNNPNEIHRALQDFENDDTTILYGNCSSRTYISHQKVDGIHFNACIYSPKSDRLILITEQSGLSLADVEAILKKKAIVFNQVTLQELYRPTFSQPLKEFWIARDRAVLMEAAEDSAKNSDLYPEYYPNANTVIMIGFYNENRKFIDLFGIWARGLVEFDDKYILLVCDGNKNNINLEAVKPLLHQAGINATLNPKGQPSIIKSQIKKARRLIKSR